MKKLLLFFPIIFLSGCSIVNQSPASISVISAVSSSSPKIYQNTTLGFKLTFPNQSWHTEQGNDPHFYESETCLQTEQSDCAALEVQNHDSEFGQGAEAAFKVLQIDGKEPVKLNSLIPTAVVIKSIAPEGAKAWGWEYDIFFSAAKKRFLIFTNDAALEQSVLPTFSITSTQSAGVIVQDSIRAYEKGITSQTYIDAKEDLEYNDTVKNFGLDIMYADVTQDGKEEALVSIPSGGTNGIIAVLVYGLDGNKVKLLQRIDGYKMVVKPAGGKLRIYESDRDRQDSSNIFMLDYSWNGKSFDLKSRTQVPNPVDNKSLLMN
ncbi:MAG TPA: hypothetical protein VLK22_01785 [Candidatus Udaeobacter sp.]|nr:hypothetical protein [Candidatus Udaeobacter sp.]